MLQGLANVLLPRWLVPRPATPAEGRALPERGCALCLAQPPHTPTDAACGHQFCYYCVTAACMADAHARCPRCDAKLSVPPAPVGTGSGTTKP